MDAGTAAADIIIPVHNGFASTRNLLEGIYRYSDAPFHIYVIDNASDDETVDLGKIYTRALTVVRNRDNPGWPAAVNQGIQIGRNPYLVFLAGGVEVSAGWLGNLLAFLDTHPRIGAVGPLNSDPGDRQCVDRVRRELVPQIPLFFTEDLHERNRILGYHFRRTGILIDGTLAFFCVALNRRAVDDTGLLDETCGEESGEDYCRRLRKAGYVLGLSLETYVLHRFEETRRTVFDRARRREQRRRRPART